MTTISFIMNTHTKNNDWKCKRKIETTNERTNDCMITINQSMIQTNFKQNTKRILYHTHSITQSIKSIQIVCLYIQKWAFRSDWSQQNPFDSNNNFSKICLLFVLIRTVDLLLVTYIYSVLLFLTIIIKLNCRS